MKKHTKDMLEIINHALQQSRNDAIWNSPVPKYEANFFEDECEHECGFTLHRHSHKPWNPVEKAKSKDYSLRSRMFYMICPSVQDLSPALHVASLANERVLRGCQEPIVENNKIEQFTKIGCAMVNMDKCAQNTPAAATEAQQWTHKTCIADVTDMCNWIDTSSKRSVFKITA